jgi:SIR2-like domain
MPPGFYTPADPPFQVRDRHQPYFKLHGSSNWAAEGGKLMLILGGGKETEIQKHPLLAWYFSEFERCLNGNQIVIVGYSFNDEHINRRLKAACTRGARFLIVDPYGVEVIDKRDRAAQITQPRSEFMEEMMPCIDGASRRNLLVTLENDNIERTKLYHFMTAHERRRG